MQLWERVEMGHFFKLYILDKDALFHVTIVETAWVEPGSQRKWYYSTTRNN